MVRHPPRFDPKVHSRTFAIAASDNATIVLGLRLMERLRDEAGSGVRIAFQAARSDVVATQLERGEVDILIGSERMVPPAMKARKLIDEMYVMVQRRGHPRGTAPLDLDSYCSLQHVLVSTSGGSLTGFIDEQMEKFGRERQVVLSVHQFILAPMIVETTDYVSTCQNASHSASPTDWICSSSPSKPRVSSSSRPGIRASRRIRRMFGCEGSLSRSLGVCRARTCDLSREGRTSQTKAGHKTA